MNKEDEKVFKDWDLQYDEEGYSDARAVIFVCLIVFVLGILLVGTYQ
jgi:hypothetical protein